MLFRKAILIIHGFAGGTYDEEDLANYLELNKNFDVFQFTLPGHDRNLSKAKYKDWINYSEDRIKWLIENGYNNIYLIGHSMGGVIAAYLASKYKCVKKLVLAAPAFHYLDMKKENMNVANSFKLTPKIIETYGGNEVIARFLKLNISTVREFMELVKKYYECPNDVNCPILIVQGKKDNIVPITSSEYVYNSVKSSTKTLIFVECLTHDVFRSNNNKKIYNLVEEFLKKGIKGGIDTI